MLVTGRKTWSRSAETFSAGSDRAFQSIGQLSDVKGSAKWKMAADPGNPATDGLSCASSGARNGASFPVSEAHDHGSIVSRQSKKPLS